MPGPAGRQSTQWRREDRTRILLERQGFQVIRCKGAKTSVHLIATNTAGLKLVQVCTEESPLCEDGLDDIPVPPGCQKEVWRWPARARKPRIEQVR